MKAQSHIDSLITKGERLALSDVDSSRFYLSNALVLSKKQKDLEKEIKCIALLGDSYSGQSEFSIGVTLYVSAIKLAETNKRDDLAAKSYNGLGVIAYQRGDYEKAKQYFLHAAQLKLEAGQVSHYAMIMTNLSGVLFSLGKYEEALSNLQKALPALTKEEAVLAAAYNSVGSIYQMGYQKLDSAQYYYARSIELSEKGKFNDVLISAYHNQGEIYVQQKNFNAGISLLKKSLALSQELKKDSYTITVLNALSNAYADQGDFKNALASKKEAFDISQNLNSSEKQEAIERLQIQFEAEKKSAEIAKKNEALLQSELRNEVLKNRNILLIGVALLLSLSAIIFYAYLRQKRRVERQLELERNRIFQNVVHEIRTPLTLISGPLNMIKDSGDIQQLQQQLPIIERNSQRLLKMVNDILHLSKLESGAFQAIYEVGDPIAFIREQSESFQQAFSQNNQELILTTAEGTISSFPKYIVETVIANLLANALKYAGSGSRIELKALIQHQNLMIVITDNGAGISPRDVTKIFQRFYRGGNATSPTGSGLGLALVSEILQNIGGTIQYSPNIPRGAKFSISLPLKETHSISEKTEVQSEFVLLLVEDDIDLSAFVQSLFQEHVQVITAFNKSDALTISSNLIPDIILTDIMLPDGSGLDLLRTLKAAPDTQHIPISVFSARNSSELRLEALQAGAVAYFTKPFVPSELRQSIMNIMNAVVQLRKDNSHRITHEEASQPIDPFIQKCIDSIHQRLDQTEFGPDALGDTLGISRSQLHRKLISLTGQSTSNFIRMVRLKKAKDFLAENKYTVKEVAYMCGFNSPSYFSKSYKELFGSSPGNNTDFQG